MRDGNGWTMSTTAASTVKRIVEIERGKREVNEGERKMIRKKKKSEQC